MKKSFTILMALVITFFTVPFGGITALADGKVYDDIADGEYKIGVKAVGENSDEESAANGFLIDVATLSVTGDDITLTFDYTKDFEMDYGISWTKLENEDPIATGEDDKASYFKFQINEIKEIYNAAMNYYVPGMPGDMGDKEKGHSVNYRIVLNINDLNNLPENLEDEEAEKEEPTKAPDEREVGKLLTEDEADAVYELKYETESKATSAQLLNPVKLLEKNDKQYIQIPVNEDGADYFRSLEINGKQVIWNSITEGPYTIQFELPGNINDTLSMDMVIQAGPNVMPHSGIEINFNTDTIETIKEPEESDAPEEPEEKPQPAPEERVVGSLNTESEADAVYELEYETDSSATEAQMKNPVKLFEKENKQYIQIPVNEKGAGYFRSLKINDKQVTWNSITEGPYIIQFELPGNIEDTLFLDMVIQAGPNVMPHNNIEIQFKTDTIKTIKEPESKLDPEDLAEGVYTLDYTFLKKGEDQASSMDNFTDGPAFVKVDQDGNLFVALTLTSANMIQWFKVNNQKVTILQENTESQTRIVEFAVNNLTKRQSGNVFVEVPGMYATEHAVDLVFDVNSLEKANNSEYAENKNIEPKPETEDPTEEKPSDEKEKPEQPTTPIEQSELTPDTAYEIDYIVNHENGTSVSISNEFFVKPAILLEKDGVKYIQITITNGDLIKDLSNKYGDALLVDTKEDGSIVVQLRMNDDLADMLIDMHIIVPSGFLQGFPGYDEQHKEIGRA